MGVAACPWEGDLCPRLSPLQANPPASPAGSGRAKLWRLRGVPGAWEAVTGPKVGLV